MNAQGPLTSAASPKKFKPYVPESMEMREFTVRAVLLGLLMTVVLGAANAYLGLRAGITIAATYPAAVIAMAAMRAWKGSLLEENIARTAGSIGEGIAAGAIFTIPAFLIAKAWPSFRPGDAYWKSTALIMVGSVLGVLFISLVRRVMVEDPELPFPSRWRLRRFTRPANGARRLRNIFSGISAWAAWCICSVDLDYLPPTKTSTLLSASWDAARFAWARQETRTFWPLEEQAHSLRRV